MPADKLAVTIILSTILLVLVISIIWPICVGAPWIPTPMTAVHKMLKMANVGSDDVVYDLGCGDGRTVIAAARKYGARAVGIEIDPLRYLWCQIMITIRGLRGRVTILFGNFFSKDLSEATVVTCYLLQDTNDKLEEKFLQELQPGTRVVSNDYTFSKFNEISKEGMIRLYQIPPKQGDLDDFVVTETL